MIVLANRVTHEVAGDVLSAIDYCYEQGWATDGLTDQSTQDTSEKFSACLAERQDLEPWSALNVDIDYPPEASSVTVFAGAMSNLANQSLS